MYNLLIADDEQLERDAIEFLIKKRKLPFNVIKARNGKEALNIFKKNKIDFLILDIKMPLIDGIEVGKEIRNINNKIPIVYLTAWSTFDFAKSAISIRALDYLVKPINKKELYRVLENYIEKQNIEKSMKNEELKTVVNQFSRSFFAYMKHGLIDEKILLNYFNLNKDKYFEGVSIIVNEVNIHNLKTFFEQKEFINNRFYYFPSIDRSTIIVFFKNKTKFFNQLQYNSKSYLINTFTNLTISIGSVFTNLKELPRSIRESSIAYSIAKKNNETIHEFNHLDEFIINNTNTNYIYEIEKAIYNLDIKHARELAHFFYDSITHLDKTNLLETYYQNVLLLHHDLTKSILFLRIEKPNKTIQEIEISFFNLIDSSVAALQEDKKDKYQRIFFEIKKELELNYNKQLTMDYYSELLNINIKYFSKLFKCYNKISFIDCLTNIRMTKAQKLLKEGNGVKESAQSVGYLDSAYFSKVFNQKFNISPSQYRQTYEKK
ncbi:MAG: response regulator transcription factor [Pleomorphochaeta sp.]